ncbi:MAG: FMN-binding glutamate synthase family protein, partial [candidate division Zixibacteria bacterium]|nr:FMN-binding glutamate synthase family protein [candidate division Zixibacteria bacterium]
MHQYATILANKGEHVPTLVPAGGFTFEDQMFKGLAMGAPFVKLIGMARSPLAATMVGKTIGRTIEANQLPVYVERFGQSKDEVFVTAADLRKELGDKAFEKLPTGAIGLYTYYERLAQGLRQLMAGSRKFGIDHMTRDDLVALTPEAAAITGLKGVMDLDKEESEKILNS